RLRWDAAVIDTGATEPLALDNCHLHSCLCQPNRKRRPCLPSANNDRIIFSCHRDTSLLLSKSYLRLAKGDLSASLTLGEAVYGASTALCCPGKTRTWRRLVRNASAHCDMTKN